ncbi:cysteine--tRNA ligase [Vermiphilus pyriformis]|nr:MAG: cysteine--tRNA ligase [Vermiphilus pyriformis]
MLTFSNTLSGKQEPLNARPGSEITMYVCGITPYDYAHLGHGRVYTTFDVLYRLLTLSGYQVKYCRNYTDIDDKLIAKAEKIYGDKKQFIQVANQYIQAYEQDMVQLNCLEPGVQPRVTDHIDQIISFIAKLIDAGKAYVARDGSVYYSIDTCPDYGKLSKQKLDELLVGARVEVDTDKKNPLDFALWKAEPAGNFYKSPWGYGRPGWHIECSVLARTYLGEHIDIHAGGADLIFPHHENEIAQSEGLFGAPFARLWLHNGFIQINKEKMSKSLGNFFTLRDLFEQFDPMVIRYYLLSHHYKSPVEFAFDDVRAVAKSYARLCRTFADVSFDHSEPLTMDEVTMDPVTDRMVKFLADDLNTPGMLGVLFEALPTLYTYQHRKKTIKKFLQQVMGFSLVPLPVQEVELTPEITELIMLREQARTRKDWKTADELRDRLSLLGYNIHDKKV